MTNITPKVREFIEMNRKERMMLDAGYRRSYRRLAKVAFMKTLNDLMLFANTETGFLDETHMRELMRVTTLLIKRHMNVNQVTIQISTE